MDHENRPYKDFAIFYFATLTDNPTFERWHIDDSVPEALQDIRNELLECIEKEVFLEMTRRCGFEYSGDFILIDKIWRSSNKVLCRLKLTESVKESLDNYVLHPAITDVCFQSCIALLPTDDKHFQKEAQFFPVGVRQVTLIPPKGSIKELYCITSAISENSYDTKLLTDSGEVLVLMEEYKVG